MITANNAIAANPQKWVPFNSFGRVQLRSNLATPATTAALSACRKKRYGNTGLNVMSFYTYSKALDSQDGDNSGSGIDPLNNRALEKGLAGFNRKHNATITVLYELPFGQGKKFLNRGGIVNHLLGGWEVSGIQTLSSGNPRDITYAGGPQYFNDAWRSSRRPNSTGTTPELYDDWRQRVSGADDRFTRNKSGQILDPSFFAYPDEAFTPGNLGAMWSPKATWYGRRFRLRRTSISRNA